MKHSIVRFFVMVNGFLFLAPMISDASIKRLIKKEKIKINLSGLIIDSTKANTVNIHAAGDFQYTVDPGKPRLPYRIIHMKVPYEAADSSIHVEIVSPGKKVISLTGKVGPAVKNWVEPEETLLGITPGEESMKERFDEGVYRKNAFYPGEHARLLGVDLKRGADMKPYYDARILFVPVLYNPLQNIIEILENAGLALRYVPQPGKHWVTEEGISCDYVIVTTNAIKNHSICLSDFVHHKEDRGFKVKVITEDDYNFPTRIVPDGRAERIRAWLQRHYINYGIRYVLLIGNPDPDDPMYSDDQVGDVPMKQIWWRLPGETIQGNMDYGFHWGDATDWYYADLTGNWDASNDGIFGERPWLPNSQATVSARYAGNDDFSVKWTGTFSVPSGGVVQFALKQRKGTIVTVDGNVLYNHWELTPKESARFAQMTLTEGVHAIEVKFHCENGKGHLLLQYQLPGQTAWTTFTGMHGNYYGNASLAGTPVAFVENETLLKDWEETDYLPSGGVDLIGEVAVGRIAVYNDDYNSLDDILLRTIRYEKDYLGTEWQKKALVAMVPPDSDTPAYDLGQALYDDLCLPNSWECTRIFMEKYGLNPPPDLSPVNPDNVVNACNGGVGLFVWFAHGNPRWADRILDVKYHLPSSPGSFAKLNRTFPAFTFQASCHNGLVYVPDCYPQCAPNFDVFEGRLGLAYQLLRQVSVATVAASEVSTYIGGSFALDRNRLGNQDFAYLYAEQIIKNHATAGDAMINIKYNQFPNTNISQATTFHQQMIYNLYGDPSLRLPSETAAPRRIYLSCHYGAVIPVDSRYQHEFNSLFMINLEFPVPPYPRFCPICPEWALELDLAYFENYWKERHGTFPWRSISGSVRLYYPIADRLKLFTALGTGLYVPGDGGGRLGGKVNVGAVYPIGGRMKIEVGTDYTRISKGSGDSPHQVSGTSFSDMHVGFAIGL
jgi:hypothetical protein